MDDPFDVGAKVRQRLPAPISGMVTESQWDGKSKTFRYRVEDADGGVVWFDHNQIELDKPVEGESA